jgi:hypothetical protein
MTIATLAEVAAWLLLAPSSPASTPCAITGQVRDVEGRPVSHLRVRASSGATAKVVATDEDGRFDLGASDAGSGAGVVVSLAHHRDGKDVFVLYRDRDPIELVATVESCTLDLDLRNPAGFRSTLPTEDWADAFALYQGFASGWKLAVELGIEPPAEPLEIAAWHASASPDASFWVGTPSYLAGTPRSALVGVGAAASRREAGGAPDNREYHELGHHALAAAFGALPRARADTPHGGYFRNPTSADAWAEGFATFFATMVATRIEGRADPSRYRLDGARVDLELDYRPWDLGGLEELAVAGALLDLVDGDADPGEAEPAPPTVRAALGAGEGLVVVTFDELPASLPARVLRLALQGEGGQVLMAARVDPSVWRSASGPSPRLPLALPSGFDAATIVGAAWVSSARADDDALTVPLADVWRAISTYESTQPESNGRVLDVADLHAALSQAIGTADADGNGRSDLDDVFVAHGLFADLDGDHELDAGETIGRTAHPERAVTVDGEPTVWPAMPERRSVPTPEGLRVAVSGSAAAARLYAQTVWPLASARDMEITLAAVHDGHALVLPPPGGAEAEVHLLADADEHQPAIVATWTADALHEAAAGHSEPALSVEVALSPGGPSASAIGRAIPPLWLFVGGAGAVAIGLVLLVVGAIRARLS